MTLNKTSLAAGVGTSVKNVPHQSGVTNLARKILVIGSYDATVKTSVIPDVPVQVFSPEDAGSKFGFGSMIHRLVIQAFLGSRGVELWVVPQAETGGAVPASGTITFVASGLKSGTVSMAIAGIPVSFTVADSDTSDDIATKAVAAITANADLPVDAVVNGVTTNQVDVTAKSKGTFGNEISIAFNLLAGQVVPVGLTTITVVGMASGAGVPAIADALNGLGTGDNGNEKHFTDVVHGYLQDSTSLNAIETYVGAGNELNGLYSNTVARPIRVLTGDVVAGTTGLTDLIALGNGRKLDRGNGAIGVPGSMSHPSEIAAQAIGHMARINNDVAGQSYVGIHLIGIDPGATADGWTSSYDNRDLAVKAGVSPTLVVNGVVVMQNMLTFYHPDEVPVASNSYRSMRNISLIQNMLAYVGEVFSGDKWQGISIVPDTSDVTSIADRKKARDVEAVKDELVAITHEFASKAWIYGADYTIEKLKGPGAVTLRDGGNGFNNILSVILSGEGGILDTTIELDTSIAVLLS